MTVVEELTAPPRLPLVLARGALASRGKRGPYEGARLPDVRLVLPEARVNAGRLRTYAQICGFADPAGDERPDFPLPPSYPHILGFPLSMQLMARADFPYPVLGLVHTGIELTQYRTLRSGERPELSVHADGPAPHRRGSSFGVVTEARVGGRLVWHSRSTYLCRHRTAEAPGGVPAPPTGPPSVPRLPLRDHWELPSGLGRRYARASGDGNPIHLHPLTAKLFGFPRHIAHGMWTFARALAATGAAESCEQLTARAEFKAPVLLPSTLAFYADEPTASAGHYQAPVRVHRFELRSGDASAVDPAAGGGNGNGNGKEKLHLTGEVTSERP